MPVYFSRSDATFNFPQGASGAVVRELFFADVNADGRQDAVLTYEYYPLQNQPIPVRVLLGNGAGGFSDGSAQVFSGGAPAYVDARAHAAGDFNGDGRTDLFFADTGYEVAPYPGAPNGLWLSGAGGLANASGNLPAYVDYSSAASAGDINGDGKLDILVANLGARGPYFLLGNGAGGFTPDATRLPAAVADPANGQFGAALLFDANNDGRADVFLGGDADSRILLNDGAGRFAIPSGMSYAIAAPHNVVDAASADFNGDGLADVVVTAALNNFTQGALQILINHGAGIFADESASRLTSGASVLSDPGANWIYRTQIADFNADGAPDLLLSGGARAVVLVNDGEGRFALMPDAVPGLAALDRAAAADLNGDGRADLLVRRGETGGVESLSTYLSTTPSLSQSGDSAANGLMGGASADTLLGGFGGDALVGAAGDDFLRGEDGSDLILGGAGFDNINGNQGEDVVFAGRGGDWALGGQGNDVVRGEDGDDIVNGNMGTDTCEGGSGNDFVRGGQAGDLLSGGVGNDWMSGDLGDDTIFGGVGADTFNAGGGIDWIHDFSLAAGDRVQIAAGTQYTLQQIGGDAVIDFAGGARMVLINVQSSTLSDGWIMQA